MSGEAEPGFGVQLGENGEEVRSALGAAGLDVRQAGDELLVRSPAGADAADRVRDVAAERGWPLRRLTPRAASLEEVFLRLAGRVPDGPEPDAAAPVPETVAPR